MEHPFWARGFRPFFAAGAAFAVFSVLAWAGFYAGWTVPPGIFEDPVLWHAHEMIFGFTMAIVAGFLLTAVANWTNWSPVRGWGLFSLVVLWLAGRIAFAFPALPLWFVAAVDCAFIPGLAMSLLVPLWRSRNMRNFVFLGLLSALTACDIAFFILQERLPLYVALLVIMMIVSVVAGRVVPSFSVAWLRSRGKPVFQKDVSWLDRSAFVLSFLGALLTGVKGVESYGAGVVFFTLAGVHLLRWRQYYPVATLKEPMLWILHAGFLWMIAAFAMLGAASFGVGLQSAAFHALTTGSIGSFTIGMMCRVTLGHTGRQIAANRATVAIFALMQATALVRVAGPVIVPDATALWIGISGLLWALCFVVYLGSYGAALWQPRKDGLPA